MKAKEWLTELVGRVEAITDAAVNEVLNSEDTKEIQGSDNEVARLEGFLAKIWTLTKTLGQEIELKVKRLELESFEKKEPIPEEAKKAIILEGRELTELKNLFWFSLRSELHLSGSIAIRKGGLVVQMPPEDEDDGPMLVIHPLRLGMPEAPTSQGLFSKLFGSGGN